ncbi:unnamed protein product [Boreogadus saida]
MGHSDQIHQKVDVCLLYTIAMTTIVSIEAEHTVDVPVDRVGSDCRLLQSPTALSDSLLRMNGSSYVTFSPPYRPTEGEGRGSPPYRPTEGEDPGSPPYRPTEGEDPGSPPYRPTEGEERALAAPRIGPPRERTLAAPRIGPPRERAVAAPRIGPPKERTVTKDPAWPWRPT